jgi:phosphoadenosine phosphosulfate reductase
MLQAATATSATTPPSAPLRAPGRLASAHDRISAAADRFGDGLVLSTSFGIQSAVMLHLATRVRPDIPVVWVDTGYLAPQTYAFAQQLRNRLDLNLRVYQSAVSPARMEALEGRLWESDDVKALNRYDRIRKVEPMQRALRELGATAWLSGLRAEQTDHRATLEFIQRQRDRFKVLPILDWTARDVHRYLGEHQLPYHPLFDEGYATVGDWHSSRPLSADDTHDRDTRFGGLKQECGLHLDDFVDDVQPRELH